MTRGLLAPLSPQEGIALRRIAHGSTVVDAEVAARLASLALVERVHSSLRLTPLGRLRFNALPKAPLMTRQRSMQVTSDYVAGVIEKAQAMAQRQLSKPAAAALITEGATSEAAADDDVEGDAPYQIIHSFYELPQWKSRAQRNLVKTRQIIMEHRQRHERLCEDSHRRIAISRSLLKATVPVTPAWLSTLQ